jgi:hypothetical protein
MVDLRDKEIESLRIQLAELKSLLNKKEEEFARKYEQLSHTYKHEKEQLTIKFETIQQEMNQLEKNYINVNHDKQRLTSELDKTKDSLKSIED